MGDRNYYPNQYNQFRAQPQPRISSLFDLRTPHSEGFSVNTSMPVYNTPASYYQAVQSRESTSFHSGSQQYYDERPPPSYEESQSDMLLSRLKTNTRHSPAWNYINNKVGGKHHPEKRSLNNLFDIPGQTETDNKSSEWSSDNYNSSQSYQHTPTLLNNPLPPHSFQGRINPPNDFSQKPSTNFSSDYGHQSEYWSSPNSVTSGRQVNEFKHSNNKLFGKQNQNRGRGKGGFRGQQNFGQPNRGFWPGRDRFGEKNNSNQLEGNSNQEGVMSVSKDQELGSEGEENNYESEKVNVFYPDSSLLTKYQYYPPNPEEMGEMFKDLVIYFFYKVPRNKKEQNPFVVICESFRRSAGYSNIDVEDGFDTKFKDRKFCTLRYEDMMMVRGVGENSCIKEARVLAGVELINKLAMSCYTLESKPEYFDVKSFEKMQQEGDAPGIYCFAPAAEVNDFDTARNYLNRIFSEEDSDVEHIFHFLSANHAITLKSWANKHRFEARVIKGEWIGVCRRRTPQYWRDKILASGEMETAKFILIPPKGIGNLLLANYDIKNAIVQLRKNASVPRPVVCTLDNVYGPPGVGPKISKAPPPWVKTFGGRGMKCGSNKQKIKSTKKKIMDMVKRGVPVTATKGYKMLSRKKRKKLREKLGQ